MGEEDIHAVVQDLQSVVQNLRTELDNALRNVEDRLENIGKTKCGDPGTFENDSSSVFCF